MFYMFLDYLYEVIETHGTFHKIGKSKPKQTLKTPNSKTKAKKQTPQGVEIRW